MKSLNAGNVFRRFEWSWSGCLGNIQSVVQAVWNSLDSKLWSCVFLGIVLIVSLILLIFTEEKLERQDAENDPDPIG